MTVTNEIQTHLMISDFEHTIAVEHQSKLGMFVNIIGRGPANYAEAKLEPHIKRLIIAWELLRSSTQQATRMNSPLRFLNSVFSAKQGMPQPFAIIFLKEGRAIAALSGSINKKEEWKKARQLNYLLPRLCCLSVPESGMISDGSIEADQHLVGYLTKLLDNETVQRLDLDNIIVTQPIYEILRGSLSLTQTVSIDLVHWKRQLIDPVTRLPIKHHSRKTRAKFRRNYRNLTKEFKGGLKFTKITEHTDINNFISIATSIVSQTYQAALGIGITNTPEARSFCMELALEGLFRGYLLEGDGIPISYAIGDLEANVFYLWATSYSPAYMKHSPGIVLLNLVFEDLIEENTEIIDFGHGDAQYKRMFGSTMNNEQHLRVYGKGLIPRSAYLLDNILNYLETKAHELLVNSGRLDKARKYWRKILQKNGK